MFWGKTPRPKQRCGVFFCHRAVSHVYKKGVRGVFGRGVFQKRHKKGASLETAFSGVEAEVAQRILYAVESSFLLV